MANCTGCGSYIPDDQGSSCSMCYGDPEHGSDGYYTEYLERMEQEAMEQRQQDSENMDEL